MLRDLLDVLAAISPSCQISKAIQHSDIHFVGFKTPSTVFAR